MALTCCLAPSHRLQTQHACPSHSALHLCRDWSLILGAPILVFGLLPSFRSVRLLNLIALVGTNYSCLYFFVTAVSAGAKPGIITRCATCQHCHCHVSGAARGSCMAVPSICAGIRAKPTRAR